MEVFAVILILAIVGVTGLFILTSFIMLLRINSNQKKMFQMFSTILRQMSELKSEKIKAKKIETTPVKQQVAPSGCVKELKDIRSSTKNSNVATSSSIAKDNITKAPSESSKVPKTELMHSISRVQKIEQKPPVKTYKQTPDIPPRPTYTKKEPTPQSGFEKRAVEIIKKIWNWIIVGEEFRNPKVSMEYAVATTWLLRAAIIILVIGAFLLLGYSIEHGMLGDEARMSLTILAGLTMIGTGLKLTGKRYHIIAQGLLGGGIATLYGAIFAGYSMFKIINSGTAFTLMILITVAAGVISVRLNSMLVAIFAVIGGYCTPIMIRTAGGNLPALFSYIFILGVCTLAIARYRDWKLLNFLSFIFTYTIFFLALDKFYTTSEFPVIMLFASLFFVLFSFIPILYNIIHKEKSTLIELLFMTANAVLFFPAAYKLIEDAYATEYVAIVTISLALFYLLQIHLFLKKELKDRNFLIILSGFTSFFITFTIPLLLSDEWITTAWAIQALVFMWMSKKMKSNFIRLIAHLLYMITFGRLALYDFQDNFCNLSTASYWPEMVNRLMTFGITIASLAGSYMLLKNEKESEKSQSAYSKTLSQNDIANFAETSLFSQIFLWLTLSSLFIYLHFELYFFCDSYYPPIKMTILSFIWIPAIFLIFKNCLKQCHNILFSLLILMTTAFLIKLFIIDLNFWHISSAPLCYAGRYSIEAGIMRLLDFMPALLLFGYFAFIAPPLNRNSTASRELNSQQLFGVISIGLLFIYTTLELSTFLINKAPGFRSGGISILWSIFAISFILTGIIKDSKSFRYTGLGLFIIVIAKVFFFDMSTLSQLYKIIAFIALGLIILSGAVIYVRFREFFETDKESR